MIVLQVLLNVGLCIALKDITKLGDSLILPGDGASHTEVFFRYIVFRPTIGEVITGKIRSCSREGVHSKYAKGIVVNEKWLKPKLSATILSEVLDFSLFERRVN